MKKNAGIYLVLISIIITGIGAVLKLQHLSGADFLLAIGTVTMISAIFVILYQLYQRRSS